MKTHKYIIIITLLLFSCSVFSQINGKLSINPSEFRYEKSEKGLDRIIWKTDYTTTETSNPEIPIYRVSYVLPINTKVTGIKFISKEKQLLKKDIYVYPVQPLVLADYSTNIEFTEPDKKVYDSDIPYPYSLYDIEFDGIIQGYHVATIRFYPFEYLPKSRILNFYPNLEFIIEYETQPEPINPIYQSLLRTELCRKTIKFMVQNPDDVDLFGSNVQNLKSNNHIQKSSSTQNTLSVYDGITPDYIIITNNSLKAAFQPFVDWKIKKGVFTIITTVEEISNDYPGNDVQEKIKNYLMNAYNKWGAGLFVLLGGDINIVPSRMVYGIYVGSNSDNDKCTYPADSYYSTAATWSYSNNGVYNGYNAQSFINILGRVPFSNIDEVSIYINKVIAYERANNLGDLNYLKNNLYSDAYMVANGAGLLSDFALNTIKNTYINNYVPSFINNKIICDNANCAGSANRYSYSGSLCIGGDIELNRNNFLSCLNNGGNLGVGKFHFIYHMDHSGSTGLGTSNKDKGEVINIIDVDNLTNELSYQILMSGGCHPANFAYDCIGKHYIIKQNGGGIAFIGNTDSGWTSEYSQLSRFVQAVYSDNFGYNIGSAFQNIHINGTHGQKWRLHLLGDPEMQVWTNTPQTLQITQTPSTIVCGENTVNITINNLGANETATICLQKADEVYAVQTITSNGNYSFLVNPLTAGQIHITVTAHNFIPYETNVSVNANSAQHLYVSNITIDDDNVGDSNGDNNQQIDAGETIELTLELTNNGLTAANNVNATLTCTSPYVSITSNQANFGTVSANNAASSITKYVFSVDKNTPELLKNYPNSIVFTVTITDGNGNSFTNEFSIDVYISDIKQGNKTVLSTSNGDLIIEPSETVTFNIDLQNTGKAKAKGINAVLSSTSSYIQSCSAIPRLYPDINENDTKQNIQTFQFQTASTYTAGSALNFNLQVTNEYGKVWNISFNLLDKPNQITGLDFTASETAINVFWIATSGVAGYNIYRSNVDENGNEVGNYVKLNAQPITFTYYNDLGLDLLTKYYYKVTAVSTTGNESPFSAPLLAWTSLGEINLFPVALDFRAVRWGINAADINNDGYKEIFASSISGNIVGLDYMGNDLYDIDNNITTISGFAKIDAEVWATPAIGDLFGNGKKQIVLPTRNYNGKPNGIYCFSTEDNDGDGKPDLLWSTPTPYHTYRGAIIADLNNDGQAEIIVGFEVAEPVCIYDANGVLLHTMSSNGNTYGTISVADLDNDGYLEIIKAVGTGIYVWKHDGTNFGNTQPFFSITDPDYIFKSSVVICDINNDGVKDILTIASTQTSPHQGKIYVVNSAGTFVTGWANLPVTFPIPDVTYPVDISVGDLNHDENIEIVANSNNKVYVWDNTGTQISCTQMNNLYSYSGPILADVDGDSDIEIIMASSESKNIHALNIDGTKVLGFPLTADDKTYCTPCIADIDNDGKNELIAATQMHTIHVWKTNGSAENIEWGWERQNQYNTGEYKNNCNNLIIDSNTTWSSNRYICGNLTLQSGTLTLNNQASLTMGNQATITIMEGATLIIDAAHILNANVKALSGSNIIITNSASIVLHSNGEFYVETGAVVDFTNGIIDK